MTRQLRPEAGGDPTSGPVRELANEPPSPRSAEDFPDAPDEPADDAHPRGDLTREELDDFAARMGVARPTSEREGVPRTVRRTAVVVVRRVRPVLGRVVVRVGDAIVATGGWIQRTGVAVIHRGHDDDPGS